MLQKIKNFLTPQHEAAYSHPVARMIPAFAWQILEWAVWLAIILNIAKAVIG